MTEQHEWELDIIEGGIFRNTDDGLEFMDLDEAKRRLNEYETLKKGIAHIKSWVEQPTSGITARQISDAVARMCADILEGNNENERR